MKRIYRITLLILGCVMALVSCRQKEQNPIEWRTELQVVSSDLVFSPAGGAGTAVLNLSGASVTSNASWCQASVSDETVNVSVDEWGGLDSRYAVLTVSRNGESLEVSVIQYGVNLGKVEVGAKITADGKAATYTFLCESNVAITVQSDVDWFVPTLEDGELKLSVTANPDKAVRIGTLTLHIGEIVKKVTVLQFPVFENTPDWVVTYSGNRKSGSTDYSTLTNTVSVDHGLYTLTVTTPDSFSASGLSEADFVRDVLVPELTDGINEAVKYYNGQYSFADFLLSGTDWDYVSLLENGTYIGYAVGFDKDGYPTGWYTADTIRVAN